MSLSDVMMSMSPIYASFAAALQELEIAELRRKNEEDIAAAMCIPADILFNPLVQRLLADSPVMQQRLNAERMSEPTPVARGVLDRYQDKRRGRRTKRR